MLQLDYALLCDYVRAEGGLAHVIAAGIDTIYRPEVPSVANLGFLVRLTFTDEDIDQPHQLELRLEDQEGQQVAQATGSPSLQRVEGLPDGWPYGGIVAINFGVPLPQEDYSLDPPPDGEVRHPLDYRLLEGATVGDRELFYVYDAANARILGFQRADGAFVRQWMAPRTGQWAGLLDHVVAMNVGSVPDGPPVATLLTPDGIVRVVLE